MATKTTENMKVYKVSDLVDIIAVKDDREYYSYYVRTKRNANLYFCYGSKELDSAADIKHLFDIGYFDMEVCDSLIDAWNAEHNTALKVVNQQYAKIIEE